MTTDNTSMTIHCHGRHFQRTDAGAWCIWHRQQSRWIQLKVLSRPPISSLERRWRKASGIESLDDPMPLARSLGVEAYWRKVERKLAQLLRHHDVALEVEREA